MTERYGELPHHTRIFLENLNEDHVSELVGVMRFHATLPLHSREMLRNMDKSAADWLRTARPEEIALLVDGIDLVRSSRSVGRLLRWLFLGFIGFGAAMYSLGDVLSRFFRWVRG